MHERTQAHDSQHVALQKDSPPNPSTQSSNPSGSIGSAGLPPVKEATEMSSEKQHKSFLLTNSPGSLIGARVSRESSQTQSFQPAIPNGKSHDMQLDGSPLLQEVAVGLSKLASILLTSKTPEVEAKYHPIKVCMDMYLLSNL